MCLFVFFKQKTAYEMRISDWSSYVCSSDLIGVTSPGSSTNIMVNLLMAKVGMSPNDVAIIGVGAGAGVVAAMKNNEVDAVVQADPATALLVAQGLAVVKVDTRSEENTYELQSLMRSTYAVLGLIKKKEQKE